MDDARELKDINERYIKIEEIMDGLENIKNKMKEEFIENYYEDKEINYIIEGKKGIMEIKKIGDREKNEIKFKINSKDEEKNGLIGIIMVILMVKKNEKCEINIDTNKVNINKILQKVIKTKERQSWSINNINYINKIIELLEEYNINIQIDEIEKQKHKKTNRKWERNENLDEIKVEKWEEVDWIKTFDFIMLKQEETTIYGNHDEKREEVTELRIF
ncbi:hypothetical protein C1645_814962 [Glomus cerebriforme]|uniref:Uncharacterized protein n=1 Tax=Glomus cerebriforme TaxID=658196 RepID=A0A397TF56_9GLOM|nr:hypothetical protein C1645_814962 [Glomus cerebriforme]